MVKGIRDFEGLLVAKSLHSDAIDLINKYIEDKNISDTDKKLLQERLKKHKKKLKDINKDINEIYKYIEKKVNKLNDKAYKMYDKTEELCIMSLSIDETADETLDDADSKMLDLFDSLDDKNDSKPNKSTNSNKEKVRRLNLGKNVEYADSVEFSDCAISDVVELIKEQVRFPFEARVIFDDSIQGCIQVVSDKISLVKKGSIIRRYKDNMISQRLIEKFKTCIEYELIEKTDDTQCATYNVLEDIQFSTMLDAIMFITGGCYGIDNGITVERYYNDNQGENTNE